MAGRHRPDRGAAPRGAGLDSAALVIAFATALIVAYALAQIIPRLGKRSAASGAKIGLGLALVFIAPTLAMNYGFEARPASLWLLNAGYMTVGMAVMGAIIGGWKQKFNI